MFKFILKYFRQCFGWIIKKNNNNNVDRTEYLKNEDFRINDELEQLLESSDSDNDMLNFRFRGTRRKYLNK